MQVKTLERCPNCELDGMHFWRVGGSETARACQYCGYVEEKSALVADRSTNCWSPPLKSAP